MPSIVLKNGAVLLNDAGVPKLSDNNPPDASCCCGGGCPCCSLASTPSSTPTAVIVTFTGVVNSACADCADFNGVGFELAKDTSDTTGCSWFLDSGLPCDITRIEAEITCESPGTGLELYFYRVQIFYASGSDGHFVVGPNFSPIDCTAPGAMNYLGATSDNARCDWSGATCDVSS